MRPEETATLNPISYTQFKEYLLTEHCEIVDGKDQDHSRLYRRGDGTNNHTDRYIRLQECAPSDRIGWPIVESYLLRLGIDPEELKNRYRKKPVTPQ